MVVSCRFHDGFMPPRDTSLRLWINHISMARPLFGYMSDPSWFNAGTTLVFCWIVLFGCLGRALPPKLQRKTSRTRRNINVMTDVPKASSPHAYSKAGFMGCCKAWWFHAGFMPRFHAWFHAPVSCPFPCPVLYCA